MQARGREGRTRILRTMLTLVDERGFEGATIAELARRTGLPASSVYWHFSSKDEIVAAAIQDSYEQWFGSRPPWPEEPDERPLPEQLEDAMVRLEGDGTHPDYVRVGLALSLQRRSSAEAARSVFLDIRKEARRRLGHWWTIVLDRMTATGPVDPRAAEAMARLTLAVLDGRYLTGQDVALVPEKTRVLALLLTGAARYYAAGGPVPQEEVSAGPGDRAWVRTGEAGREALVAGAIDVLCDQGPAGTTVALVCERAGLPASSLYWHFDDLGALVAEAVDTAFARWSARSDPWPGGPGIDHRAAIAQHLRDGFRTMLAEPAAFRIGYMLLLQRDESEARQRFRRIRRQVTARNVGWFAEWLGSDAPRDDREAPAGSLPELLSWAVMTLVDGLFVVEAVSPLWPITDASEVLAAGLAYVTTSYPADHRVSPGDPRGRG